MFSPIPQIQPIKPIDLPELKPIGTDSVSSGQSLNDWHAAGGGVPLQYKGREHVWHKKVAKFAAGGEVHMAKGGDPRGEMRATPESNPQAAGAARALKMAHEFASRPFGYNNPPGEMLSEFLGVPDVANTLERIGYGEPLTTGKGMTTKPREEVLNAAMAVVPLAQMTKGMPIGAVIKNKGGNWLTGSVEKSLGGLKGKTISPEDMARAREAVKLFENPEHTAGATRTLNEYEANNSLNKWVDSNLTNYVKKEMATPDDPVRRLAEQGISHLPEGTPQSRYMDDVWANREKAGFPAFQGTSRQAQVWESLADSAIRPKQLGETIRTNNPGGMTMRELFTGEPGGEWALKAPDTEMVHELRLPGTSSVTQIAPELGFDHIINVLRQDVASGRIRPEQLNKVSMEQAVRRTHEFDQEMAKKMAEAQIKNTEGMPTYKDYPEAGYKWIELTTPKNMKLPEGYSVKPDPITNRKTGVVDTNSYRLVDPEGKLVGWGKTEDEAVSSGLGKKVLADALKYEGDTMGHCVGGYCPDVLEGRSRIYSLRDAKGEPHVTVEVKPPEMRGGQTAEEWLASPHRIQQIKGKGNAAPKEEYLPYVQDFVKGGQWSDVGDIRNTGLLRSDELPGRERYQKAGMEIPKYLSEKDRELLEREWGKRTGVTPTDPDFMAREYGFPPEGMAHGGEVHMAGAGDVGKAAAKLAAKLFKKDAPIGKLEEVIKAQQAPMAAPHGTGLPLMPRDQGMYTPGIPQVDLPRMTKVDKARAEGKSPAYTERMQDLLDSPTARKKVDKLINQGKDLNMTEWYGTEPLRQVAMNAGLSLDEFKAFMAQMASASQRNPVDQQNKMGSYLHYLSKSGQLPEDAFLLTNKIKRGKQEMPEGTPIELPPGYGSLAQGDIFSRGKQIASGDIEGALPPDKKLGTFYRNYLGNLRPVTVDVNAVRGPIIERGDPRWLASKLVEKDEEGNVIATHFPRKDVAEGRMSLKEAKDRPGFWEAAPSGSEYAGFEDLWQRGAKRHDVSPAEAQALGWYGSADVTALKTKPELYIDNLERMIKRTAEDTGQHPLQVMDDVIKGKGYLYKEGGIVKSKGGLTAATKSCSCHD